MKALEKPLNYIIILLAIAWVIGFWHRNNFAYPMPLNAQLLSEPIQEKSQLAPFIMSKDDMRYLLQPLYRYELYGLVVSYQKHNTHAFSRKSWNDHINVADVCVVWGDNASKLDLNLFKFWNGEFTCNIETTNNTAFKKFHSNELSNNHLLTDNEELRTKINNLRVGDQIYLRGYLTNYQNTITGSTRKTSTTRNDNGNGACETVLVEEITHLSSMHTPWRTLSFFCGWGFLLLGSFWCYAVAKGIF